MNAALPASKIVIFFCVMGLSLLVASLDFARRRAKTRRDIPRWKPAQRSRPVAQAPVEQAKPLAAAVSAVSPAVSKAPEAPKAPVDMPQSAARIDRLQSPRGPERTVTPTLALGNLVPLPKFAPRVPRSSAWLNSPLLWCQQSIPDRP
jgi:hypothetical protein